MLNNYEILPKYSFVNDEPRYIAVNGGALVSESQIIQKIIAWILFLLFQGFVVYALIISNDNDIFNKCGASMMNFILMHFIINMLEGFIYMFWSNIQTCVKGCCLESNAYFMITELLPFAVLIATHATLLGVGFDVSKSAMTDIPCIDAISSVSPTKGPLSGFLAYVYIGLDIVILIIITCWALYTVISHCSPVAMVDSTKAVVSRTGILLHNNHVLL